MWMTVQKFCFLRTAHLRKCHHFRACNVFLCHSLTQIITWINFFTLRWARKNGILEVRNLQIMSLFCDQSCVTTYWSRVWFIYWLMIIYAWLSTTQQKVGTILVLPKTTPFWAMCSVNRAKMCDSLGFYFGTKKESFKPITLMKMLHLQNRQRFVFLSMMILNLWLAKTSAQCSLKCSTPLIFYLNSANDIQ